MGRAKQLLPFGDTTLTGWVVRNAEASSLDEVLVVIGFGADEVEASFEVERARFIRNPFPERGNHSSLLCGLDAAPDGSAVMIILADMPGVSPEVIDRMIAVWRQVEGWAAVADYQGTRSHPFLLSSAAVKEVPTLHGPRPLWRLLGGGGEDVLEVRFERKVPRDVDTPDDYLAALNEFGFDESLPPNLASP